MPAMDRRIRKAVELLERDWRSAIRISDLAQQVGLGASRLEHLFKREAKTSIRDYIRERRLAAAALLLESTEERISVISFSCGFRDVSNFNHAFKRRYGLCPREFRERAQSVVSSFDQLKANDTN